MMAGNFKKTAALLLALLTLAGSMASCGDDGKDANKGGTDTTDNAVTTAGADEESSILYQANIPEGTNYDGYEFKIHSFPAPGSDNVVDAVWYDADFSSTEETGDTLNDATFIRTRNVEEKLGITVKSIHKARDGSALQKAVQSGTDDYDIGFVNTSAAALLSQNGYLMDLYNIPTLDLSQPWWDQNAVNDLSIANHLYMVTGDISINYKKSIGILLFNKELAAQDLTMPDPYELVANKKWTIDAFLDMAKKVSEDVNGDGKMDEKDKYGLLFYSDMASLGLIGAGVDFTQKDSDDIPQITFYSDKTLQVFEKYTELLYNKNISISWTETGYPGGDIGDIFYDDRGLFDYTEFHAIEAMRQKMESDFGILPFPLYDEKQENYRHSINPEVGAALVIPKSNLDLDRIGYILDALGAESKNILTPAYYDVYLKGKGTRDTESEASLDIIFSTLRYDIGYIYNVGNIGRLPMELADKHQDNLTSQYKSHDKIYKKSLDLILKAYEKNN